MKFLDFFSGIGGFRLGFEQAGHECVEHVEWDKYAQQSYKAMYSQGILLKLTNMVIPKANLLFTKLQKELELIGLETGHG